MISPQFKYNSTQRWEARSSTIRHSGYSFLAPPKPHSDGTIFVVMQYSSVPYAFKLQILLELILVLAIKPFITSEMYHPS